MYTKVIKSLAKTTVTIRVDEEGPSMQAVTRIKDRCDLGGRCQFIFTTGNMEMCDQLIVMSTDRTSIVCNRINGNRIRVR